MDLGIAGRGALVTAGSRGIGRACALALANEGARVAVCGRSAEAVADAVQRLGGAERGHAGIVVDLEGPDGPEQLAAAAVAALGDVEILVHNLGGTLGIRDPLAPAAAWRRVLRINLEVAIELDERLIPPMRARGWGRVVAIGSVAGIEHQGALPYAVAKAALGAYVRGLGRELAATGVVVAAVAPGTVRTDGGVWDERLRSDPAAAARYVTERLPAGRFQEAQAIADAVAFLCSARATDCCGSIVTVDAGQSRAFSA